MTDTRASQLVTFGETMGLFGADRVGRFGGDRSFALGIGGAESNVAIAAVRLGARATWFGRVGSDATGDLIARLVAAEGVDTVVVRDPGFTGLMVKHQRFADLSHVDYHRSGSAGSRLCPDDIPAERLRAADILHVTGITPGLSASARDTVYQALEMARGAGVRISLDVNYRRKVWSPDTAAPVLRELAGRSDIIFAGREEADLLTGAHSSTAHEAAASLGRLGVVETIVKDGPCGCSAIVDGVPFQLPALRVRVVDPVGAGDAFVAGYLADRLAGQGPQARLVTAIRAGALAVSVPGDCESLPSRTELDGIGADDVAR